MNDDHEFSVDGARAAAERGDLDAWVAQFLASPGSDNAPLGAKLQDELGWWTGPVLLPIDELHRLAGPPGDPVVVPVPDDAWDDRVDAMAELVDDGAQLPPVVVASRDGQLVLEDGNHRVESLRQAGRQRAWAIVGFERREDRETFEERLPPGARR